MFGCLLGSLIESICLPVVDEFLFSSKLRVLVDDILFESEEGEG